MKIDEMTDEQKRIRIAEVCGFTFKDESALFPDEPDWQKYKAVYRGDGFIGLAKPDWIPVPDYLRSLEAMHEAEWRLTAKQREEYAWMLCPIDEGGAVSSLLFPAIHAPARQRAEAFLHVLEAQP